MYHLAYKLNNIYADRIREYTYDNFIKRNVETEKYRYYNEINCIIMLLAQI